MARARNGITGIGSRYLQHLRHGLSVTQHWGKVVVGGGAREGDIASASRGWQRFTQVREGGMEIGVAKVCGGSKCCGYFA